MQQHITITLSKTFLNKTAISKISAGKERQEQYCIVFYYIILYYILQCYFPDLVMPYKNETTIIAYWTNSAIGSFGAAANPRLQ